MLPISVLLTEGEIAAGLLADLRERRIPEKYFYWSSESALAWLALCRSEAYLNYRRSLALLSDQSAAVLDGLERRPAEIVSLGCGDGSKEVPILDALSRRGADAPCIAVDVSQWLLESALATMARAGHDARGIKADLSNPAHLAAIAAEAPSGSRIYTLLGNTVGALDHAAFLPMLEGTLRSDDRLLVDAELWHPDVTLGGYLNPDNRRFATAPLRSLGIGDADGEVAFDLIEEQDPPGLYRLRKHFRAARDLQLHAGAGTVHVPAGARLDMGFSCKYTSEAFREILGRFGGLTVEREFVSEDGGFVLVVARKDRARA